MNIVTLVDIKTVFTLVNEDGTCILIIEVTELWYLIRANNVLFLEYDDRYNWILHWESNSIFLVHFYFAEIYDFLSE